MLRPDILSVNLISFNHGWYLLSVTELLNEYHPFCIWAGLPSFILDRGCAADTDGRGFGVPSHETGSGKKG